MKPHADNAIKLLESIRRECGSASLAYWTIPNVILTLSGARSFCDGVFWSQSKTELEGWDAEIKASLKVLSEHTELLYSNADIQSVRENETYASFDLLTRQGFEYVLSQSEFIADTSSLLKMSAKTSEDILSTVIKQLKLHETFKDFSDEDMQHVAFGLLVGYPDDAISESVQRWSLDDPFEEPLVDADIRGAGYYFCPQPTYSYPRHLIDNPKIVAHEKLWSQILKDYYNSPFHKELEAEPAFQDKIEAIGSKR